MQAGCSVTSLNYEGESCLHLAAGLYSRGEASLVVVQDLIKAGADINQRNSAGETAVCSAVRTGTLGVSRSGYLVIIFQKENNKLNSIPLDHIHSRHFLPACFCALLKSQTTLLRSYSQDQQ